MSFPKLGMPKCLSLELSLSEPWIIKVRIPPCYTHLPTWQCWLHSLALAPVNTAWSCVSKNHNFKLQHAVSQSKGRWQCRKSVSPSLEKSGLFLDAMSSNLVLTFQNYPSGECHYLKCDRMAKTYFWLILKEYTPIGQKSFCQQGRSNTS